MFPTVFFLSAQVVENISNWFLLVAEVVGNRFFDCLLPKKVGNVVENLTVSSSDG